MRCFSDIRCFLVVHGTLLTLFKKKVNEETDYSKQCVLSAKLEICCVRQRGRLGLHGKESRLVSYNYLLRLMINTMYGIYFD
jgi:hypothetical protein